MPVARRPAARPATPHANGNGETPRRILAAATRLFAEKGFNGARVDAIARRAAINKRMLYHYFGNKEALYLAVLEAVYADLLAAEAALDLDSVDPVEGIERLCRFLWRYYEAHPDFIALLNTENLHRARYLRRSARVRAMHNPLVERLQSLLDRGAKTGALRAGVDAVQLYITIAGLGYFYLSNHHTLSTIFGRDLMKPRARAARAHHVADVVLAYLLPG